MSENESEVDFETCLQVRDDDLSYYYALTKATR